MQFITIDQLKARLGAKFISIVRNPKTSKVFGSADNGVNLKVEASLDTTKEIRFMYEDDATFNEGCIVNVTPAAAPIAVL